MSLYFPRRWHFGLVVVLVATLYGIQLSNPVAAEVDAYSQLGRRVSVFNWGSGATIGYGDPFIFGDEASFELVQSQTDGPYRFVQTGWIKQFACGGRTTVFWEHWNDGYPSPGNYANGCGLYYPTGDADYYNEYNPNNDTWCNGYQGFCVNGGFNEASWVNPSSTTQIRVYGETTYTGTSRVQMGGPGIDRAVWITNVKYKPTANAQPWEWQYVTQSMGSENYAGCGQVNPPCPYDYSWGYAAGVLLDLTRFSGQIDIRRPA